MVLCRDKTMRNERKHFLKPYKKDGEREENKFHLCFDKRARMRRHLLLLLVALVAICAAKSFDSGSNLARVKRNFLLDANRFPAVTPIPYYFWTGPATADVAPLDSAMKANVMKAMNYISEKTCIEFQRKSTANFKQSLKGGVCKVDPLGKGAAETEIILVPNVECTLTTPLLVRSIMLGIGFIPNSARPDVATYLTLDTSSINASVGTNHALVTNAKVTGDIQGGTAALPTFEYGSILSFSPGEFSDRSKPIFKAVAANADYQQSMGTGRVTFADIKMINDKQCTTACTTPLTCINNGYTNPGTCAECLCPEGFGGADCSMQPDADPSDPRTSGFILKATALNKTQLVEFGKDPNTGIRSEFLERVDWVTAPAGKKVEITIIDFGEQCNPGCKTAGVEIKAVDKKLAGMRICCKTQLNKPLVSDLNPTPIISYNRWSYTTFTFRYRAV